MWLADGKLKGFYNGFSMALAKNVPLAFIQFICYENLKFLTHQV